MDDYTIRQARVADADEISQVAWCTWHTTYENSISSVNRQQFLERAYTPGALKVAIEQDSGWFYVATFSGKVVGYAQLVERSDTQWDLIRLYVHPDHQRRGLGQGFLQVGARAMKAEGGEFCYASVETENKSARAFYQRFGFQEYRDFARFLGNQVIRLLELRASVDDLLQALAEPDQAG